MTESRVVAAACLLDWDGDMVSGECVSMYPLVLLSELGGEPRDVPRRT